MPEPTPIPQLLQLLQDAGVDLVAEPPARLLFDGPVEQLEAGVLAELRSRAGEVVSYLNGGPHRDRGPRADADPFRRGLEDDEGEFPDAWIPKPGELLVGQLARYERGTTTYGTCAIAVVLDEDSGQERAVWILHHTLKGEFASLRPVPGERVGIKRLPDAENAHGQRYQKWLLRVDRQGEAQALPDFGEPEEAVPPPPPTPRAAPAGAPTEPPDLPF
jgi:hypothetical protein